MKKLFTCLLGFLLMLSCNNDQATGKNVQNLSNRPNIIVIMADDLGYSDLACYGGEIETPALDYLAKNGLQFTSFYNTARCCPSRASFLTGLYSHQAGIGRMTMDMGQPGYQGTLDEQTATIAELLKSTGYQTGMVGKWHVSLTDRKNPEVPPGQAEDQLKWLAHQADFGDFSDPNTYPTARGFDRYYGNIWGVVDYFDPFSLVNGKEPVKSVPKDFYYTDAIGDSAIAYVKDFTAKQEPFFLYVAHCAPHWPLQAPDSTIQKYADTYKKGWRAIRQQRYQRMLDLELFDSAEAPLSDFMFPEQSWENNPDTVWDARAMAVHAAMVDHLDQSVGKLIAQLKTLNQLDNTLIVFFSDNGASSERPSNYGPGFDRAGSTRTGEEVYFPVDKSQEHLPGPQTVHSGIGPVWANVANTPFRYWKAKIFEGGINTPMIMHWPAGIAKPGAKAAAAAHIVDLLPTFLELAGSEYPETFKGKTLTPAVGESLVPVLHNPGQMIDDKVIFWEHFGSAAIRDGHWKLVRLNKNSEWQLYDLSKNKTETNDLAAQFPEKVKTLAEKWEALAGQYRVYPAPN